MAVKGRRRFAAPGDVLGSEPMKELLRTNDPVRLSWLQAVLRDAGIDSVVLDHYTSFAEGNIGAIPRRLMVAERDHQRALAALAAAGEPAP